MSFIMPSLRVRLVLSSWLLALAGCAPSCQSHGEPPGAAAQPDADGAPAEPILSATASAPEPHAPRPPRHGGLVGLLLRAARETSGTPEQKATLLGIQQTLHDTEPPLTPLKDYQSDLAAGIREGQLVLPKLQADYAAIDKVVLAQEEKQAEALDALHAALDAPGRHTLVAAARARLEFLDGGLDAGTGVEAAWVKHRLARVTGDLSLDDAQKAKVAAILLKSSSPPQVTEARKETMRKHGDAVLTAFDQDVFDAKKLDLSATGTGAPAHQSLEHEVTLIGQILPLLTPEQREKLAVAKLRRVGHWAEEPEPWSPFEDFQPGNPTLR